MINQLYSSIYLGDSSVQRIYQGDDLIYLNGTPDILLEYIANGADDASANPDVYFDTGFTPQLSTKAEFKYEAHVNQISRIFGCGNSATAQSMYNFNTYANGNTQEGSTKTSLKFFYRGGNVSASFTPLVDTPYTVTLFGTYSGTSASALTMIVNGTEYTRTMTASTDITLAQSAYIFRWHGNEPETASGVKFYYVKIWEDNNLIRFYIPVLHYTNGKYTPCFYDKVNDTYIYNLGTDSPTYKIQGDYLLDWLGSEPETSIPDSSAFYLRYDTGVVASNQLQVDTRGRLVWGREQYLYGSGTSGQTTPSWQSFGFATSGGSTDADKMKFRVDCGAGGTSNYRVWISDSSVMTTVNRISHYFDENRAYVYLNDTRYNTPSPVPDTFSTVTMHLLARHGDNNVTQISKGARIYFINFTTANIPDKTIVPVLHNSKPEFLDLNSGTYLQLHGNTAPYGELLIPKPPADIPLRGIAARSTCGTTGVNDVYFPLNMQYPTSVDTEYIVDFQLDESALTTSYTHSNYIITSTSDSKMFNLGFSGNHQLQFTLGDWDGDHEDYATYDETLQAGTQYRADANLQYTSPSTGYYAAKLRVYDSSWSSYIVGSGGIPVTDFKDASLNLFSSSTGAGYLHYGGIYVSRIHFLDDGDEYNDYQAVLHWNGTAYVPCFKDVKYNTYVYNAGSGTPVYLL